MKFHIEMYFLIRREGSHYFMPLGKTYYTNSKPLHQVIAFKTSLGNVLAEGKALRRTEHRTQYAIALTATINVIFRICFENVTQPKQIKMHLHLDAKIHLKQRFFFHGVGIGTFSMLTIPVFCGTAYLVKN